MTINTGNTKIEFSVSGSGLFTRTTKKGNVAIIHVTPDPNRFLNLMIEPLKAAEIERQQKIDRAIREHFNRVEEYKYDHICACCSEGFDNGHARSLQLTQSPPFQK